jgi:hypothetical protein
MHFKPSKYNAYRLSYRLFFSFSDTVSLSIGGLEDINKIMVALLPTSPRTLYQVAVFSQGAMITINSVNDIDMPKLVNRLKTHSSKRFFLQDVDIYGELKGRSLWGRGYLLTTQGSDVDASEGFSLLKSKKIPLMDYTT